MNTFTLAVFACLVVLASAKPSGIWGGHVGGLVAPHLVPTGPVTVVGASGVVSPAGAAGPAGVVNGHGAIGPNGIPNAPAHGGIIGIGGIGGIGGIAGIAGIGAVGHGGVWGGDDGQWHGEGLLESQDLAGAHGLGLGLGLGHGHW